MTQSEQDSAGVIRQKNTWTLMPPQKIGNITLLQMADITGDKRWTCWPRVQICHEVILMLSGEAVVTCNGEEFPQSAGRLVIIPEGVIHSMRFTGTHPTRIQIAGFHFQRGTQDFIRRQSEKRQQPYDLRPYTTEIRVLLNMLVEEYFQNGCRPSEPVRALLYLLLLNIGRCTQEPLELSPGGSIAIENTDDPLTRQLCLYIREHALEIRSLKELGASFMYSYSYLSHHFSANAGYSLKQYWERYRLEACIRLMHDESLSLTQIAQMANFQSIQTFSRAFLQTFGLSPSKYRQLIVRQPAK